MTGGNFPSELDSEGGLFPFGGELINVGQRWEEDEAEKERSLRKHWRLACAMVSVGVIKAATIPLIPAHLISSD